MIMEDKWGVPMWACAWERSDMRMLFSAHCAPGLVPPGVHHAGHADGAAGGGAAGGGPERVQPQPGHQPRVLRQDHHLAEVRGGQALPLLMMEEMILMFASDPPQNLTVSLACMVNDIQHQLPVEQGVAVCFICESICSRQTQGAGQ